MSAVRGRHTAVSPRPQRHPDGTDAGLRAINRDQSVRSSFDTTINVLDGLLEFARATGGSTAVRVPPQEHRRGGPARVADADPRNADPGPAELAPRPTRRKGRVVDIERSPLPGIGLRHVLTTAHGHRVGVVSHHGGRRDLVIYRRDDPDSAADIVTLTTQEADALADLLCAARIEERLAELHRQVDGLVSVQVPITTGSPYAGRTLADTRARTRTGASVVAVVRDRDVIASPRPQFTFAAGDVAVVIGTAEGTAAVADIFSTG